MNLYKEILIYVTKIQSVIRLDSLALRFKAHIKETYRCCNLLQMDGFIYFWTKGNMRKSTLSRAWRRNESI